MVTVKRKKGRPRRIPEPSEFGELLTIDEAAQCLGISYSAMARCVHQNNLPILKFGNHRKLSRGLVQSLRDGSWRQLITKPGATDRSTA